MPPKGRTKALQNKFQNMSKVHEQTKVLSKLDLKLSEKRRDIEVAEKQLFQADVELSILKEKLSAKKAKLASHKALQKEGTKENQNPSLFSISHKKSKKRKLLPTTNDLAERSKVARSNETMDAANAIHGGSSENQDAALTGLYETITRKFPSKKVVNQILNSKAKVQKAVKQTVLKDWCNSFKKSDENVLRSLNVYYSHDVMGKSKYINVRKANRNSSKDSNIAIPNYIPYKHLSSVINNIDIGTLHDLSELDPDESLPGYFRSCKEYVPRLAKFYLHVNELREDKLISLHCFEKKDEESIMFGIAIGGDGAPAVGTSLLISFVNVGKRIASSSETFMIFGGDVDETSVAVRKYASILLCDLRYLESKVFEIDVGDKSVKVEFSVAELPNDMKMLAFLCGELTNSATYFSSFANVSKHNATDFRKTFGTETRDYWKPFKYSKRTSDALAVAKLKKDLSQKRLAETTLRNRVTEYISKTLKSRQEVKPLLENFIDKAKPEPLHIKNNTVKGVFMKILKIVMGVSNIEKFKSFSDVPEDTLFFQFVLFIKSDMNCNFLAKKLKMWFNESVKHDDKAFTFRFRGKESLHYMKQFPNLILMLINKLTDISIIRSLLIIHLQSICLRKVISLSVRIESFTQDDLQDLFKEARFLFKISCVYDMSISPSLWTLCNCVPFYAKQTLEMYGVGLGINTMEGREQKHQMLAKYSKNTTQQCRWPRIFRHEFLHLVYLRENGYDQIKYRKRGTPYIPKETSGACGKCRMKLVDIGQCPLCDCSLAKKILLDLDSK